MVECEAHQSAGVECQLRPGDARVMPKLLIFLFGPADVGPPMRSSNMVRFRACRTEEENFLSVITAVKVRWYFTSRILPGAQMACSAFPGQCALGHRKSAKESRR